MKNIILKYFLFLTVLTISLGLFSSQTVYSNNNAANIEGSVIFSDDKTPVNEGQIKVFLINEINREGSILQSVILDQNGKFKLTVPPQYWQNGIKIMAYPNDFDNIGNPFEPAVADIKKITPDQSTYFVTIEVNRVTDGKIKSQGNRKSETESKSIQLRNYPNPFNPSTLIKFDLPEASKVTLKIFNTNGETVATLAENENMEKGITEFEFKANDLPSGIYIYRLTAGNLVDTKKMMLVK